MSLKKRFVLAVLFMSSIILYIKFVLPSYPQLDSKKSIKIVKKAIFEIYQTNDRNMHMESLNSPSGDVPVEYVRDSKKFFYNLNRCENDKSCLIHTYNDFMNHWTSEISRKQIKAYYMISKYGLIGEQVNKSFLGKLY